MFSLLIVDDEPIIRNGLRNTIDWEGMGYDVPRLAASGNQALKMMLEESYQVVLTDIQMPGLNGIELIMKIRQIRPQTIIVIISGHKDFEYAHAALQYHVEDYILKPISKKRIIETFNRVASLLKDRIADREKLEREQLMHKQYLTNLLIHGSIQEAERIAEENDIVFQGQEYRIVLLQLSDGESLSLGSTILREHEELLPISFLKEQERFVLLVPSSYRSILMHHLKRAFEEAGQVYRLGIGNEYHSMDGVRLSYNEALKALKDALPNTETYYQEEEKEEQGRTISLLDRKELIKFLLTQENEQALSEIQYLFSRAKNHHHDIEDLYNWCVSVIYELKEYLKGIDVHELNFIAPLQMANIFKEADYDLLEKLFVLSIQDFQQAFHTGSSNQERIVAKTITLVNERYMDKSLSLQSISEELQISFSYLSTIFKSVYKKNFSSYLLDVRMAKAFQLIQLGQYKIYEVADKVGFSNARYFTETYKKYFSVTPSKSALSAETQ